MPTVPHCDELFQRYFAPWYSEDDLASRGFHATHPDVMGLPDHVGKRAAALSRLADEAQKRYIHHLAISMTDAAIGDFGSLLQLQPPVDFDWIQAIDDYYDLERISALIKESDPTEDGNPYFISCVELGTLIAKMLQSLEPQLEWLVDSPYWESSLWHPRTASIIPPTHWAIKKFSDYGWDDGLVAKIHCGTEILRGKTA